MSGWLRQKRSWDSGWLLAPEWAPVEDEEKQFWNIWETKRKGDIGRLDKKFCIWWWQSQELPRTGKRLVDVGCFLPTLESDRVTGWLDENDVSWEKKRFWIVIVLKMFWIIMVLESSQFWNSGQRVKCVRMQCHYSLDAQILGSHSISIWNAKERDSCVHLLWGVKAAMVPGVKIELNFSLPWTLLQTAAQKCHL